MLRRLALIAVSSFVLAACQASEATDPQAGGLDGALRVGLIPNIAPDEQRARYQPFADHLEDVLDLEVELFVASDYAGVVTALASDRIDVAYLGGLTYLQAAEQVELTPLVTEVDRESGDTTYESAIVVRADSTHTSVADLLDDEATVALGDVSSTSGSLYPRMLLIEAGAECSDREVTSCPPLPPLVFTGGHDAAAQAVLSGSADAAGLELRILHRLEDDGVIDDGALRVIATADVEGYPWVARTDLGAELHDSVRRAFLDIDDPQLLDLMRAESYVEVEPADYAEMRDGAIELGLIETS